jgi:hypothetical protein
MVILWGIPEAPEHRDESVYTIFKSIWYVNIQKYCLWNESDYIMRDQARAGTTMGRAERAGRRRGNPATEGRPEVDRPADGPRTRHSPAVRVAWKIGAADDEIHAE